jgi:hypothetical protein
MALASLPAGERESYFAHLKALNDNALVFDGLLAERLEAAMLAAMLAERLQFMKDLKNDGMSQDRIFKLISNASAEEKLQLWSKIEKEEQGE